MEAKCVIIGASHAGVNCAFALRKEGWLGSIDIYDSDPYLPYHRPPLSKEMLASGAKEPELNYLKTKESYRKVAINLWLSQRVLSINRKNKFITLDKGNTQEYTKLVIATGATAMIPPIRGIESARNVFSIRMASDTMKIRQALEDSPTKRVLIIGGGYIGLEAAASLAKAGAQVTILERELRILKRVALADLADYFYSLHQDNGVEILCSKNVISIEHDESGNKIKCSDDSSYDADIIIVGVGITVNQELAYHAGIKVSDGIEVNQHMVTNDPDILAIGDCTLHYNQYYDENLRLESVQNAVDQAKVAAATICGKEKIYNSIPWFWSDQYDVKLQMVGLSKGSNQTILRNEEKDKFSLWHFNDDRLLAVDAINHPKAYMLGTKFIKSGQKVNKINLHDISIDLNPKNLA